LQELKIRPVGSEKDIEVDIRIIVATNENLEKSISEGRFREDLYHRLNEFSLIIPPLRERTDDISLYANHFLVQANAELEKEVKAISPEAMQLLEKQHWSGNLRELRNVIRRAVLFAQSDEITPETLPTFVPKTQVQTQAEETAGLGLNNSENEKKQIETALKIAKGNKAAAARMLKIDRKTLYNKMEKYGMEL
jgi:two-component system response regulator HydG